MASEEQIHVNGIRINLAILETEPIKQQEPKAQTLAAGLALVAFGSVLWTVLGLTCVNILTQAYNFKESVCYLDDRAEFVSNKTCSCIENPECRSQYPCIRLHGSFETKSGEEVEILRGIIYDTIYDVNSEVSTKLVS